MVSDHHIEVPGFAMPVRGLAPGEHRFLDFLPDARTSPVLRLVGTRQFPGAAVVESARVRLIDDPGFCWVDESVPCIILCHSHYQTASDLDLYLDLMHEVTHIRQILEKRDVWDEAFAYHRRPTEIEGYAVAVAECRRLGLSEAAVREHLENPWMTPDQVAELHVAVDAWLARTDGTAATNPSAVSGDRDGRIGRDDRAGRSGMDRSDRADDPRGSDEADRAGDRDGRLRRSD